MPTIFVTAAQGAKVPQESHPTRYYPDFGSTPMAVEATPFVARLIVLGDLVRVTEARSGEVQS